MPYFNSRPDEEWMVQRYGYLKRSIEGLEEIKLEKPCQLLKLNEKNKKLCTKVN